MNLLTARVSAPTTAALREAHREWAWRSTAALLLPAAAAGVLLAVLYQGWPMARLAVLGVAGLGFLGLAGLLGRVWRQPLPRIARRLNRQHPALEDSSALLLRDASGLNLLEQLQQHRLSARLPDLRAAGPLLPVDFRRPLALAGVLLALAAGAWWGRSGSTAAPPKLAEKPLQLRFEAQTTLPPTAARILETRLRVQPPTYTRQPAFSPAAASFRCLRGSRVRWTVRLSRAAQKSPVLELGSRRLPLRAVPGRPTEFATEIPLTASVLYRIRLDEQVSEEYAIEVQPDQPPTIRLITPKAYTLVEFGRPPQVAIRAQLHDDFGLTRARLVATIAQGQGEAVKFREVVTDLSATLRGQPKTSTVQHLLRLPALGLTYGDEVYFYLQAWDNHQQRTRSDTYLVQWEDTTVQESALDVSLGVSAKPAYFRSQRQIIIDTEKLLAEQRGLPAATLLERSNGIGFDQKILRMRYGKFLGEEADETIGGAAPGPPTADAPAEEPGLGSVVAEDHTEAAAPTPAAPPEGHSADDGHDHGHASSSAHEAPGAALTAELMDPYIHHHDDSETADFLEPAVKAKLQAVLSQMWEAELRLRTGRPREALPFEYRALRLLKQVQQQTRAYVKKAGFTPPPMPEATTRLTGDLAGAAAPRRERQLAAPSRQPVVRAALRLLAQLPTQAPPPAGSATTLDQAGQELARAALQKPGAYLNALRELRSLSTALRQGQPVAADKLPIIERALTALLPPPPPTPTHAAKPGNRLARRYLQELGR
ncbi:hypothetical protein HNQ93_003041 [Hymenobacter luteus]|uniref:DUF4175 family protein n=2 Tax=Hymenobacter TaxID=89966 RepID=A0A7W9T281_9BACT|nr:MULTISPECIES: DUF4175 family protein [Hymenobacter]MBB4603277.1 hypothetical protein [Hymenobacter latericoloratus]MBB6060175.1 hypothetical protein [Hymenobacter luteus]